LTVRTREGEETFVIVPFEGGIRALRGETGGEAWRAPLTLGNATSGMVSDLNGDNANEIVVVTRSAPVLYVVETASGKIISETKLESNVVGAPFAYNFGEERGALLALTNGELILLNMNGEKIRSVKLDGEITTAPLVISTSRGMIATVGTTQGLLALDAAKLRPLGRIVTEGDTVRGTLIAADLDMDGSQEILMLTRLGRIAVVNTADGKIRWFADGAADAESAAFADVNDDGTLDVLVPAGATFAAGFSGRDGSLIWKVQDDSKTVAASSSAAPTRSLTITSTKNGRNFLVGGDASRVGLRAVELKKGAAKSASN
jgi:hypothetical protein